MIIDITNAFETPPPEPDFVLPGFVGGTVGALIAPGGVGKSFWALELSMSLTCKNSGLNLVGLHLGNAGKVFYFVGEDSIATITQRIYSLGSHIGDAARTDIANNLTIDCFFGEAFDAMNDSHLRQLIARTFGSRLIVIDTLSRIHQLDENSNSDMARLIGRLECLAAESGASVLFLHHVSKGSFREGRAETQQAARGASALIDNARWCAFMSKMTTEENTSFSLSALHYEPIHPDRANCLLRLGVSKQNYGAMMAERWYERISDGVLKPIDLFPLRPPQKKVAPRWRTRGAA